MDARTRRDVAQALISLASRVETGEVRSFVFKWEGSSDHVQVEMDVHVGLEKDTQVDLQG